MPNIVDSIENRRDVPKIYDVVFDVFVSQERN
jgi:hypothetical protein